MKKVALKSNLATTTEEMLIILHLGRHDQETTNPYHFVIRDEDYFMLALKHPGLIQMTALVE